MNSRSVIVIFIVSGVAGLLAAGCQHDPAAQAALAQRQQPIAAESSKLDLFAGRLGEAVAGMDHASARDLATDMSRPYAAWKRANKI